MAQEFDLKTAREGQISKAELLDEIKKVVDASECLYFNGYLLTLAPDDGRIGMGFDYNAASVPVLAAGVLTHQSLLGQNCLGLIVGKDDDDY
jgi:hypothetical protein